MQARIEPLLISLVKLEVDDDCTTHIIKVKMRRNTSSAASEMYNVNMNTFDDGQPEEFLSLLRKFKIATDVTRTTTPYGQINYLRTMLRGKALQEFDERKSQYGGETNTHLKLIQDFLLEYFFPINALSKKKSAMRRAICKP